MSANDVSQLIWLITERNKCGGEDDPKRLLIQSMINKIISAPA